LIGLSMRCVPCGYENEPDRRFCAECGTALVVRCAACGAPAAKFCGACGARLATVGPAAAIASTSGAPEVAATTGARRQLTVLFCDLVGSTELAARLDPEYLREVVRAYQGAAARRRRPPPRDRRPC